MELTQLIQFKAIADEGNMTRASERLFISQPALSKSLRKLEEELGCQLFYRKNNVITLNHNGSIVLDSVNKILDTIETMRSQIRKNNDTSSLIVGGSAPPFMRLFMPVFMQNNPLIDIKTLILPTNTLVHRLLDREIDIAVSLKPIIHKEIYYMPYLEDRLYLCVPKSHPLAECTEIYPEQLDGQTLLSNGNTISEQHNASLEFFKSHNVSVNYIVQNDYMLYQQLIQTQDYLVTSSLLAMQLSYFPEHRVYIPFKNTDAKFTYYINYLKECSPVTRRAIDWFVDYYPVFCENQQKKIRSMAIY